MKRTDIERRDRDLKKSLKKEEAQYRRVGKNSDGSVIDYADKLFKLLIYNDDKIYNIKKSAEILNLIKEMNQVLDEKELDNMIRKAIRTTKIKEKKLAFQEIKDLPG